MIEPIPYADYVRIEIHAGGKAEIIELVPDKWGRVRAQVTVDEVMNRDVVLDGPFVDTLTGDMNMTLKVSGPTATHIRKDSDR